MTQVYVADLKKDMKRLGRQVNAVGRGTVELAYYRGYQCGYEQAMRDAVAGCLRADHAMQPSRQHESKDVK